MGDNDASAGDIGRDLRQPLGDVLVGKAVEAVASDPFGMQLVRDRIVVGERIMIAVECGIEAGDLRQRREILRQGFDRSEIMRLMQRRQRYVALQARHDGLIDQHRLGMIRPTMHDAMADRNRVDLKLTQPRAGDRHRGRNIGDRFDRIGPICHGIAGCAAGA